MFGFHKRSRKKTICFFSCYFFCFCLDFLVSIKAILLRTTNTHQAYVHSGDTVLSYSFYNKRKLVNSCFWLCFFFFPRRSWCKRAVLYIFYNTLWLLKIKICGKRVCVCVKVFTRPVSIRTTVSSCKRGTPHKLCRCNLVLVKLSSHKQLVGDWTEMTCWLKELYLHCI